MATNSSNLFSSFYETTDIDDPGPAYFRVRHKDSNLYWTMSSNNIVLQTPISEGTPDNPNPPTNFTNLKTQLFFWHRRAIDIDDESVGFFQDGRLRNATTFDTNPELYLGKSGTDLISNVTHANSARLHSLVR